MNCDHANELLPWLLNGTLEEGERREVEAHLASCEACRRALDETRFAWRASDAHPPSQVLTALAFGDTMPSSLDPALVESHVEGCPRCAADLELARLSRRLENEDNVAVMAPAARRRGGGAVWRTAAVAATFACLVAAGGWVLSLQQARSLEDRLAAARATAPEASTELSAGCTRLKRRSPPPASKALALPSSKPRSNGWESRSPPRHRPLPRQHSRGSTIPFSSFTRERSSAARTTT